MISRREFVRVLVGSVAASALLPLAVMAGYWVGKLERVESRVATSRVEEGVKRLCLPLPRLRGEVTLEEALANRRSIREYRDEPLELEELSQILWAVYGITETRHGFKTTPSAGATYPLEVYVVVAPRGVKLPGGGFLEPGSYHYDPHSHCIELVKRGNLVEDLYHAALEQEWVRDAPVNIVITAVFERTTGVYGERGVRYVWIEVGHAGQNVYLQATAMGLATVAIGAFYDEEVREVIGAPPHHRPAYIMPVARPIKPYKLDPEDLKRYIEAHRS